MEGEKKPSKHPTTNQTLSKGSVSSKWPPCGILIVIVVFSMPRADSLSARKVDTISWHDSGMRILKYPRIIQDARTSKKHGVPPRSRHGSSFNDNFYEQKNSSKKSCKDRNLWHSWHHLLSHIAMSVVSLLDSPWEPSLLEQIGMDVRGHNMYERNSLSRIKIQEFAFRTHWQANLVLAQCWSNIFQTYMNASTALEGMVKHKVRLTTTWQKGSHSSYLVCACSSRSRPPNAIPTILVELKARKKKASSAWWKLLIWWQNVIFCFQRPRFPQTDGRHRPRLSELQSHGWTSHPWDRWHTPWHACTWS